MIKKCDKSKANKKMIKHEMEEIKEGKARLKKDRKALRDIKKSKTGH